MGGLIPFRLQQSSNARRMSTSSPSTPSAALSAFPAKSIDRSRPSPVTKLTIFPCTEGEWRDVMVDVKNLYTRNKYKQCSARCIQVLESIKDTYRIHPLYQIYLSFFAASSLELTSCSLNINSPTKLSLLQQSLAYYQNAESHMEFATFCANPTIFQAARQSQQNTICSNSSSVRSSVDSIFSSASNIYSPIASPTSSCYSISPTTSNSPAIVPVDTCKSILSASPSTLDTSLTPAPLNIKKRVTFSLQRPCSIPDAKLEPGCPSSLIDTFPSPPSSVALPSPIVESFISEFLLSRSFARYQDHLSDLHKQIGYHTRSVHSQIASVQSARKAWRSNLPTLFTDLLGSDLLEVVDEEESKKVELTARIDRLRANGWQRKRFVGSRYQALCENALMELEWATERNIRMGRLTG